MRKYSYLIIGLIVIFLCLVSCCYGSESVDEHFWSEFEILKPASCTEKGEQKRVCRLCGFYDSEEIELIPHSIVVDLEIPPTCTSEGLSRGEHCSVCEQILLEQVSVPKVDHIVTIDEAVPSTCTSDGKLEGSHCSVCNLVFVEQVIVPKSGHTVVIDPAILPTHETDGLSEGMHCSVCGQVLVEQVIVPKLCHEINIIPAILPTCTSDGLSEGMYCAICDQFLVKQVTVPKLNHIVAYDSYISPTCTADGKSEGAHCSVCQLLLIPQTSIPAKGHSYDDGVISEKAYFWQSGKTKYSCTVEQCDASYEEEYSVTTISSFEENSTLSSEQLYSFCAISDVHIPYETSIEDFKRALSYAAENCDFTCIAGDLTSAGSITEGPANEMELYKNIVDNYSQNKPVYAISGNHETSYGVYVTDERIQQYTGNGLYYSFSVNDDVFIMVGYYGAYHEGGGGWRSDEFVSVEELQWLYETLEANRNKRCFVFTHVLPHEHEVGNPNGLYTSALIWNTADGGTGQAFMSLIKHYKNVILFHGHSHTKLQLQELDANANCSDSYGYRSVHIPSLTAPRDVINGSLAAMYSESEGYIVDVYDDCVILKGRDFVANNGEGSWISGATYKIDTKLYTIEPNTFTDSTGIIKLEPK